EVVGDADSAPPVGGVAPDEEEVLPGDRRVGFQDPEDRLVVGVDMLGHVGAAGGIADRGVAGDVPPHAPNRLVDELHGPLPQPPEYGRPARRHGRCFRLLHGSTVRNPPPGCPGRAYLFAYVSASDQAYPGSRRRGRGAGCASRRRWWDGPRRWPPSRGSGSGRPPVSCAACSSPATPGSARPAWRKTW